MQRFGQQSPDDVGRETSNVRSWPALVAAALILCWATVENWAIAPVWFLVVMAGGFVGLQSLLWLGNASPATRAAVSCAYPSSWLAVLSLWFAGDSTAFRVFYMGIGTAALVFVCAVILVGVGSWERLVSGRWRHSVAAFGAFSWCVWVVALTVGDSIADRFATRTLEALPGYAQPEHAAIVFLLLLALVTRLSRGARHRTGAIVGAQAMVAAGLLLAHNATVVLTRDDAIANAPAPEVEGTAVPAKHESPPPALEDSPPPAKPDEKNDDQEVTYTSEDGRSVVVVPRRSQSPGAAGRDPLQPPVLCGDLPQRRSLKGLRESYSESNWRPGAIEALEIRIPAAAWVVAQLDNPRLFDFWFTGDTANWHSMLQSLSTGVHESAHLVGLQDWSTGGHRLVIDRDRFLTVPRVAEVPRAAIVPTLPTFVRAQDYTETYLSGDSGQQGFHMLLDELNAYTWSLRVSTAFVDQQSPTMRVSSRDGLLALMAFTQSYLALVRTQHEPVYQRIADSRSMRNAVVTLWDRALCALEQSGTDRRLGIRDRRLRKDVMVPQRVREIERLRELPGTYP